MTVTITKPQLSIRDELNTLRKKQVYTAPAFSAWSNTTASITSSTLTKYQGNRVKFDTNGCYDSTTYRFTPNVPGIYKIGFSNWFANGSGACAAYLYKNGSQYAAEYDYQSSGFNCRCSTIMLLNGVSDYVEAYVYQTSGSNQIVDGNQINVGFYGYLVKGL